MPHKTLISDFISFSLFGVALWMVNLVDQNSFPGSNLLPLIIRAIISMGVLTICLYMNNKFIIKNGFADILSFRKGLVKGCLGGGMLGGLVIAAIWATVYLMFPFEISWNPVSRTNVVVDIVSYVFGNTLEELLFRGFLLMASIRLFGKIRGVILVSVLFGLFHLQGAALAVGSLSIVVTTFTMSLLLIAVIFYTKSIWTAVTLHVTGNLLLHTLGLDGTNNGIFQIKFISSTPNGYFMSAIFEIVVLAFASVIFLRAGKQDPAFNIV